MTRSSLLIIRLSCMLALFTVTAVHAQVVAHLPNALNSAVQRFVHDETRLGPQSTSLGHPAPPLPRHVVVPAQPVCSIPLQTFRVPNSNQFVIKKLRAPNVGDEIAHPVPAPPCK